MMNVFQKLMIALVVAFPVAASAYVVVSLPSLDSGDSAYIGFKSYKAGGAPCDLSKYPQGSKLLHTTLITASSLGEFTWRTTSTGCIASLLGDGGDAFNPNIVRGIPMDLGGTWTVSFFNDNAAMMKYELTLPADLKSTDCKPPPSGQPFDVLWCYGSSS